MTRTGDVVALAAALPATGVQIEARAGLALLIASPEYAARLTDASLRGELLALAREHGFTHVAVELGAGATRGDAAVLRS